MHFSIQPIYNQGQKRSQRERDTAPRILGDVQINMDLQSPMGWPSLSAYLFRSSPAQPEELPRLYEVRLQGMATLGLVLHGVEIVDGKHYPQAWHCRPLDDQVVVPWTACPRSSLDVLI